MFKIFTLCALICAVAAAPVANFDASAANAGASTQTFNQGGFGGFPGAGFGGSSSAVSF